MVKELKQLHDREVMTPVGAGDISKEAKRAALPYLMFLKQKRCGRIKGRGCADGRKQRLYTLKEDASAPTVAIESVMLACTIDAKEGRDVAVVDIPGAFMQADVDELTHIRLEGEMAELLTKVDPKLYRKYIQIENGKKVLYAELKKALYGTLKAALLFWKLLTKQLLEWGYTINPHDWCVANKTIDGKQCTILWHVDDMKISHVATATVTDVIAMIDERFGKEAPIAISRGKTHAYLGMTLDFGKPGKVMISMYDYIEGMLKESPPDMDGYSRTPAPMNLLEVRATDGDNMKLSEEDGDAYHHMTAKLLFLCKRARPDIQTSVAFLTTRVKDPHLDDYKKLARCMRYLRSTKHLPLTLEADDSHMINWWADAAFAVHHDKKSHTGGAMSMGKGVIYGASKRQKLNTKSSTEAELVAADDILPQALWTRNFLLAQGYGVKENIMHQDNQSTILLETNGKASSSKRTRHIDIRYFFITDRISRGELTIKYCSTHDMVADYFSKPLQGQPFDKFRDFIINIDPLESVFEPTSSKAHFNDDDTARPQECVGAENPKDMATEPTNT